MKSNRIYFVSFLFFLIWQDAQSAFSKMNCNDVFVMDLYKDGNQENNFSWQSSSAYEMMQFIQFLNRNKYEWQNDTDSPEEKESTPSCKPRNNAFFRGFAWVAEHIADGIGYLIDGDTTKVDGDTTKGSSQATDNNSQENNKVEGDSTKLQREQQEEVYTWRKDLIRIDQADGIRKYELYTFEHKLKKQRLIALQQTIESPHNTYEEKYVLSHHVADELQARDMMLQRWGSCYGTPIQQQMHQEFIAIVECVTGYYNEVQKKPTLVSSVFDFSELGIMYNQKNFILQAAYTADFCWSLLDCCIGVCEGFYDVGVEIVNSLHAPRQTVINFAYDTIHSFVAAGRGLSKIIRGVCELGYIGWLRHVDEDKAEEYEKSFLQRFIAFDDSVQEKIKNFGDACVVIQSLPAREICRHGTHIALDVALTHKTFNAVGKLSRIARAQSAVLVKKIADKVRKVPSRSVLVVTAEGVELPIVSESLHLLTESQDATTGSSISKSRLEKTTGDVYKKVAKSALVETEICALKKYIAQVEALVDIEADLPRLRKLFDGTRKGFGNFANKTIKPRYKHFLAPEFTITKKGKINLKGFHHDFNLAIEKSGLLRLENKVMGKHGIYKADVWCKGVKKPNTFFPSHWTREETMNKILEAYDNFIKAGAKDFELRRNGKYFVRGLTKEGIAIEMYISEGGEVTSAYPSSLQIIAGAIL